MFIYNFETKTFEYGYSESVLFDENEDEHTENPTIMYAEPVEDVLRETRRALSRAEEVC